MTCKNASYFGLKEGDLIRVKKLGTWNVGELFEGTILQLIEDDGSRQPWFEIVAIPSKSIPKNVFYALWHPIMCSNYKEYWEKVDLVSLGGQVADLFEKERDQTLAPGTSMTEEFDYSAAQCDLADPEQTDLMDERYSSDSFRDHLNKINQYRE